jgi:hypothetical protein
MLHISVINVRITSFGCKNPPSMNCTQKDRHD